MSATRAHAAKPNSSEGCQPRQETCTRKRRSHGQRLSGKMQVKMQVMAGMLRPFENRTRFLGMTPHGEIASPWPRILQRSSDLSIGRRFHPVSGALDFTRRKQRDVSDILSGLESVLNGFR